MGELLLVAQTGGEQTAEVVTFWILAVVAVGAGFAMIVMRNIIHGALMLVLNFAAIAGMYILLQTGFLGVVQIIVYAGAIMVLFLFVIMLLGVDRDDLLPQVRSLHRIGAGVLAVAILAGTMWAFIGPFTSDASICNRDDQTVAAEGEQGPTPQELLARAEDDSVACAGLDGVLEAEENGSVSFVAERLFTRFTFPFELAGLLLTVATIGAIVLGRRKDPVDDRELLAQPDSEQPRVGLGSGDHSKGTGRGPDAPGAEDI